MILSKADLRSLIEKLDIPEEVKVQLNQVEKMDTADLRASPIVQEYEKSNGTLTVLGRQACILNHILKNSGLKEEFKLYFAGNYYYPI